MHSNLITDGHEARVGLQSLPSLIPYGSVMAGKNAFIGPCKFLIALKVGCQSLTTWFSHRSRFTLPKVVLLDGISRGLCKKYKRIKKAFVASENMRPTDTMEQMC